VLSKEDGTLSTDTPEVVFLEETAGHAKCDRWSRAFSNRVAFDAYVKENPKYADAKPLTWAQWSNRESAGEPDTYIKPEPPEMDHAAMEGMN
jgi:hypothetical protein